MSKITLVRFVNIISYLIAIIEYLLFFHLRKSNFGNAILSLQIFFLVVIILSIIPIFSKRLPKKKKFIQIVLTIFLFVGFLLTLFL